MKKLFLVAVFLCVSSPLFSQGIGVPLPVMSINFSVPVFAYNFEDRFRSLFGMGVHLEFMIGGRVYFYGILTGEYYFKLTDDKDSLQFSFGAGLGYLFKRNFDVKGISAAMNIALLGIGLDMRDIGTREQNSAATYRFQMSFPVRFHFWDSRAIQFSPFVVVGAHTVGAVYNIILGGGVTLGLTF